MTEAQGELLLAAVADLAERMAGVGICVLWVGLMLGFLLAWLLFALLWRPRQV